MIRYLLAAALLVFVMGAAVAQSGLVGPEEAPGLRPARNLSDVTSASTSRTNLGLGSLATQAANAVAITGGTITGTPISGSTGSFSNLAITGTVSTAAGTKQLGAYLDNSVAPTSAGSSYAAGNTITCAGGTFTTATVLSVDAVSGGGVTKYHVIQQGVYTVAPASCTQGSTSGSGSGAVFALNYGDWSAGVLQIGNISGGVNGPTNLGGFYAGAGMTGAALGNTYAGFFTLGGGANTGDGLGGGTGFTAAEGTTYGWCAACQMTTDTYPFAMGVNAAGHENGSTAVTSVGTDNMKWTQGSVHTTGLGFGTLAFAQNPAQVVAIGNFAAQGSIVSTTVTGAANNGSGLIRLTVTTTGILTGDTVAVGTCNGTVPAFGKWASVTVIDGTHLDLVGSTFSGSGTTNCALNAFASKALANSTIVGYKALGGSVLRSTGPFAILGNDVMPLCSTCKFIVALGPNAGAATTTALYNLYVGYNSAASNQDGSGNVILGNNADLSTGSKYDAVAIGGAGNGGTGAVASNKSVVVGARSTTAGGDNSIAVGYGITASGGGQMVLSLNSSGITNSTANTCTFQGNGSTPFMTCTALNTTPIVGLPGKTLTIGVIATDPTITSGAGVPSSTQPNGSIYLRSDGGAATRFYVTSGGGVWAAVTTL